VFNTVKHSTMTI